jgi:hypothetical protein
MHINSGVIHSYFKVKGYLIKQLNIAFFLQEFIHFYLLRMSILVLVVGASITTSSYNATSHRPQIILMASAYSIFAPRPSIARRMAVS